MKMSLAICFLALLFPWHAVAAPPAAQPEQQPLAADFTVAEAGGITVRVSCKDGTFSYLKRNDAGKDIVVDTESV